jgi:hypothetical protein
LVRRHLLGKEKQKFKELMLSTGDKSATTVGGDVVVECLPITDPPSSDAPSSLLPIKEEKTNPAGSIQSKEGAEGPRAIQSVA